MNSDPTTNVPYVPRTQLPKVGYRLMEYGTKTVAASACPLDKLVASKWGIKFNNQNVVNSIKSGFFENMMREHANTKIGFGQGLFAVSVQTQHQSLYLLENKQYTLEYIDPSSKEEECRPVIIKALYIHNSNRVAWVWLE